MMMQISGGARNSKSLSNSQCNNSSSLFIPKLFHSSYFPVRSFSTKQLTTFKNNNKNNNTFFNHKNNFCANKQTNVFTNKNYLNLYTKQVRFYSSKNIIQFNLADVGEGIRECEVVKWYVSAGQKIHQFDKVAELLSDKATVEITSRYDGIVTKLYYHTGDIALVGKPLIDIQLSSPIEDTSKVVEEENDKRDISDDDEDDVDDETDDQSSHRHHGKVKATPAVRRIARENKVKLSDVIPKDKTGRIRKEDIIQFLANKSQTTAPFLSSLPPTTTPPPPISIPSVTSSVESSPEISIESKTTSEGDKEVPIRGIQKQMVKTMTAASLVPHFGYCEEFVVDDLMKLRSQLKVLADLKNIKLSYLPFFIKACSVALKEFPVLNSHLNTDASVLTYKGSHNIGIAMDTAAGLLVPNIKNVQDKSILEIAQEINRLQSLGKEGKLPMSDLKGGTITLSNIGNIGGTYASPVLFLPEVAIGAIGKIQRLPRFDVNDNVVPVNLVQISWSADHRVIDGATMARFVARMKLLVENPTSLLAELK